MAGAVPKDGTKDLRARAKMRTGLLILSALLAAGAATAGRAPAPSRAYYLQIIRADSSKEAETIWRMLQEGAAFDDLARQRAPEGMEENAGYAGRTEEGELEPAIRAALASLKMGTFSPPIETQGGYFIVKWLDPQEAASHQAPTGSAEYYLHLGLILAEVSDEAGEMDAYRKAINLNPDLKEAYVNLGEVLRRRAARMRHETGGPMGRDAARAETVMDLLDDAIDQFKIALRLDPRLAEAHHDLGLAYAAQGLLDLALLEFQEALSLRPDDGEILKSLAAAFLLQAQYEQAWLYAKRAEEMGAEVGELRSAIGRKWPPKSK